MLKIKNQIGGPKTRLQIEGPLQCHEKRGILGVEEKKDGREQICISWEETRKVITI